MLKFIGDFEKLKDYGFELSHVAVYPKQMVKVVDWEKSLIIEIGCSEPSINVWTGKDSNSYKIPNLWVVDRLEITKRRILIEPNIKEHLYYEKKRTQNGLLKKYLKDLIKDGLVIKEDTQ